MSILIALKTLLIITDCFGKTILPAKLLTAVKGDTSSPGIVFFGDFDDNKNNRTVSDNKKTSARINGGVYYLSAVGHAYGESLEVKIDTRNDFEIQARIRVLGSNSEHKFYYSMLFCGRQAMDGNSFTFAKDGFVSVDLLLSSDKQLMNRYSKVLYTGESLRL